MFQNMVILESRVQLAGVETLLIKKKKKKMKGGSPMAPDESVHTDSSGRSLWRIIDQ